MNVRRANTLVVAVLIAIGISSVGALAQYGSGTACSSAAPACPTSTSAGLCEPAPALAQVAQACPAPCPTTTCPQVCPQVVVAQAPPCPQPAPVAVCPPPCPPPVAACPAAVPCPAPSTLSACTQSLVAYHRAAEMCVEGSVVTTAGLADPADIDYVLTIKTADGQQHRVWLAPNSYLCTFGFTPNVGDSVAVTGAPTGSGGDIIARQIMWNNQMFAFRSAEGVPMWASRDPNFVRYASTWNSGQMATFSGRIDKIYEFNPGCPELGSGLALRVRVNGQDWETVPSWQQDGRQPYATVHLGPTWYVKDKIARLRRGQTITATGSPVTWNGGCAIIASQVQQGACNVAFRDTAGRPLWAGGWQNWSQGTRYASLYDPSYMRTISGSVESMDGFGPVDGLRAGTLLTVRCADGSAVRVALIPEWSVEKTGLQVQKGDQVMIAGPVSILNGQQVLIASHLQSGGHVFALQDCVTQCLWVAAQICPPVTTAAVPATIVSACPTGACF